MTAVIGTVIAGSKLIAIGKFTGSPNAGILWQAADGSHFLWLMLNAGVYQTLQVGLPAGYMVVGAEDGGIPNQGGNTVSAPGISELMLEDASGNLAYGSFYSSPTESGFTVTSIGSIGPG